MLFGYQTHTQPFHEERFWLAGNCTTDNFDFIFAYYCKDYKKGVVILY